MPARERGLPGFGRGASTSERMPTLAEVLEGFGDRIELNLEIKTATAGPYEGLEERALAAVEERGLLSRVLFSCFDDSVLEDIRDLNEWLGAFPGDCLVELDYATVAGMFDEADLVLDDSSADVWASIEALQSGDWEAAGQHYGTVAVRWADAMATSYAN